MGRDFRLGFNPDLTTERFLHLWIYPNATE
jgi:hypothetical protein